MALHLTFSIILGIGVSFAVIISSVQRGSLKPYLYSSVWFHWLTRHSYSFAFCQDKIWSNTKNIIIVKACNWFRRRHFSTRQWFPLQYDRWFGAKYWVCFSWHFFFFFCTVTIFHAERHTKYVPISKRTIAPFLDVHISLRVSWRGCFRLIRFEIE